MPFEMHEQTSSRQALGEGSISSTSKRFVETVLPLVLLCIPKIPSYSDAIKILASNSADAADARVEWNAAFIAFVYIVACNAGSGIVFVQRRKDE
jgi:ABC-type Fe3+-siderophore transport system permease subunit